jgi:hypothetical protein
MGRKHTSGPGSSDNRSDLRLCVRIFLILGFTWLIALATPFAASGSAFETVLVYMHVVLDAAQGVFIFAVFVANARIYKLYADLFRSAFKKRNEKLRHESEKSEANAKRVFSVSSFCSHTTVTQCSSFDSQCSRKSF